MDSINETNKNKNELKARIIETANKAFSQKGIRAVHMDDVAAKLSISKRTLYELFTDKEHLLLECLKENQRLHVENLQKLIAETTNPLELILNIYLQAMKHLPNFNAHHIEELQRYPMVMEHRRRHREEDTQKAVAFFKQGVEEGLFRPEVNYEVFHRLITLGMDDFLNSHFLTKWSLVEIFDTTIMVYMRGICTPAGINYLESFLKKNK